MGQKVSKDSASYIRLKEGIYVELVYIRYNR